VGCAARPERAFDADANTKLFIDRHMTPGEKRPPATCGIARRCRGACQKVRKALPQNIRCVIFKDSRTDLVGKHVHKNSIYKAN
jgi:hypothetical protein